MDKYAEIAVGDHGTIFVEIEPTVREGWQEAGIGETVEKVKLAFEKAMDTVRTTALGFVDGLKTIDEKVRPDEAQLEFELQISGEAGVFIKAGGDAAFKVSLTWKKSED